VEAEAMKFLHVEVHDGGAEFEVVTIAEAVSRFGSWFKSYADVVEDVRYPTADVMKHIMRTAKLGEVVKYGCGIFVRVRDDEELGSI
jgi:hypothetical protein